MMDFLNFTFANGWHFLGVLVLISAALSGLGRILCALAVLVRR